MDFYLIQPMLPMFYNIIEDKQNYEVIWTRTIHTNINPPEGFYSIGYESSYFISDHFSASCDCMMIPRWHGTDDEGLLFMDYFNKLNQYGMFNSAEETEAFLKFYLSFDWTETGDYETAEVFIQI